MNNNTVQVDMGVSGLNLEHKRTSHIACVGKNFNF